VSTRKEVLAGKSKLSQEDSWLQVRVIPPADMTFFAAYIVDIAAQVFGQETYDRCCGPRVRNPKVYGLKVRYSFFSLTFKGLNLLVELSKTFP
jgi:hypothetical protein